MQCSRTNINFHKTKGILFPKQMMIATVIDKKQDQHTGIFIINRLFLRRDELVLSLTRFSRNLSDSDFNLIRSQ